jgi:hypothetical protein
MANLTENATSLTVAENSLATPISIPAPTDVGFAASALTVTVTSLPVDGTVLLADGITPVVVGETLTVAQLTALKFRPALNDSNATSTFAFTVTDPTGNTASATATLAIGASNTPLVATWTSLDVPQNGGATPIGISAPTDVSFSSSQLTVKVTSLPTSGTVLLSDGTTRVTAGETLTVAQLIGLEFVPSANGSASVVSDLAYSVTDPGGHSTNAIAMLEVDPDTPPVTTAALLTVAENSGATPIGILAPMDASFPSSQLTVKVTGLPTDGSVVLSNGTTLVTIGEALPVAQLTGLEFVPTTGASAQSSSFSYSVSDPTGSTASGSATLKIGPNNSPLVTTPTSLTVAENSGATAIGIVAPSDASYAASQLSVTVTALPTDGAVLLSNGTTPVTLGESLTVAQLTGLLFKSTQDNTGQSSSFGYTVSDPAGKTAAGTATLTTGPNPIVLENEKPGTPESVWQVNPGDDSTKIQGFTTSISTNVGETVDFKIDNQTGVGNYQINIYRLGYYGGDGARLVDTIQHQATTAIVQPNPITDPSTGLVDAGNWQVTDSWNVPSGAVSGVYVANIVEGSQVFQVPFIIKDPNSQSDIVFQTDDETWQAYNGWGGSSVYGGDGPAPTSVGGTGGGAAYAVSYNRPITTLDGSGVESGPQDTIYGGEFPALYWLEENGYDVSYISGMDTATNGSLLLDHKVFMDAGHDEYWTDSQVANVEAAENAGVNLAFLSGNEIFWQTRFEPSIDGSATANRTMVTYKDSHQQTIVDPNGTGTGSFLAPTNFGGAGMPSNALTGTVFQGDETPNANLYAITIPYGETNLRIWRNTSVANTQPGQTATLASDLIGYEWDSSPDNGFRPVGLIDLSSTTINTPAYNTNFGNVDTSGTATHNLVEYRDPTSGALVFGAGTVYWSWGLDNQGTGAGGPPGPPDPSVQQATVNFLADMGVQPSTLQASLVLATESTDHTPPTSHITSISTTTPVEGQSVTVTGTATDAGGGVIAGVDVSTDGGKTWHPASSSVGAVSENWSYTFAAPAPGTYTIESRAVDDSVNLETPGPGLSYTALASSSLTLFSPSSTPATADVNDPNAVEVGIKFTSTASGEITGIRFYKGPSNTGTHVGDLWSATGTLLASAAFTNETASGWQQVNFSTPVKITPGATYVASYLTSKGNYSDTPYYFDTLQNPTNGSLSAIADGLNGLYAYASTSTTSTFPSNIATYGDNYWVDVVFDDTSTGPQASDYNGLAVTENQTLSISTSTLLANDTDTGGFALSFSGVGNSINGTVSYNPNTSTVTFVPTPGYTGPASFQYSISDTNGGSATGTVSLTVNYPVAAQSLFNTGDTPSIVTENDPNSVELGVRFVPSVTGTISGIRFYKGSQNTGTHVADLWSATGTLLATATFTNETASGWQQVNLSTPVVVTAGTTYVVSYHTNGDYSANPGYFTSAHTNGELTAPASGTGGGNGLYAYGTGQIFPTNTFGAGNYWVDVVFDGDPLQPPVANNYSAFAVQNTPFSLAASTLLANDSDPYGLPLSIMGVSNPSNGTVTYNSGTITFVPTSGYTGPAGFTYTISDGQGDTASANVALTVTYPPPVVNNDGGFVATENTGITIQAATLLANDTDPNGLPMSIAGVSNPSNGTVSYNSGTVTFMPTAGYTGPASFSYSVTDSLGGVGTGTVSLAVDYPITAQSLFNTSDTPATVTVNDPNSVELGVKFQASATGAVTGIRFYKGPQNTGTHVADLWSATGTLLASVTFTNETASGWQQVNLSTPVLLTAGNTYVVSYHTNGDYSADSNYFATARTNGELTALASGGVYAYGTGPVFPTGSYNSSNYWVDVVFDGTAIPPPVANNDSGFVATENTALTIPASTLLANDTDSTGIPLSITGVSNPSDGTVGYDPNGHTVTFMPTAGYSGTASFTYSVNDGDGGTASANVSLLVNDPSTVSLLNPTSTPAIVTVNDPSSIELGMQFQASTSGDITGIRFYKGPENAGTHTADLWSSTGTLIASATFTNETASGWQQVNFASPVPITAGSTYVASYHTNGDYSADPNFFATAQTNGPLTGINGVYASGTSSLFPTNSFNATSYDVDVVFQAGAIEPPVAINDSGFVATENTALTIPASALLANDTDPSGFPLSITGVSNPSNGTATYDPNAQTISFVPATNYTGAAGFEYSITDGHGNTASADAALTVNFPPPVANDDSGFVATENTALTISASALLANDTDSTGIPLSITGVSNPSDGTVGYDPNSQDVTFVPTAGYSGTASFTYSVNDGNGGTASANVSLLVNDPSTVSLFSPTSTPSIMTVNDPNSIELGVEFQASTNGDITGIRFYKDPQNTGTHVADLWSATGTLLASATFTNETASGWQQVNFTTPVSVTAGTTYVASYHTNGNYSADPNYFAAAQTNGPLTAPANSPSTPNGVYAYGSSSLFPTNSFNATNYAVDAVFKPQLAG